MELYKISGPNSLKGNVDLQGSKNAVLPMMAAAVVNKGITRLCNCPDISDVHSAVEILRYIGCRAEYEQGVLTIDSCGEINNHIPCDIMTKLRASFLFAGALLARCKSFKLSQPGGCNIGLRPIDIHLESFRRLGATVETSGSVISCKGDNLKPCELTLRFPSVGATENIMILASSLKGKTRIINAAREPEIEDLQNILCKMGAKITGAGTGVITVEGEELTCDNEYYVMPDRIDCATYLTALACNEGSITLNKADPGHILNYINILRKCGMYIETHTDKIFAQKSGRLKGGINVSTRPYPGFATDTQSLLMAALSLSDGVSLIRENIFESRFCLSGILSSMGADIRTYRHTASVRGVRSLNPVSARVCDLRSGAALCCAMMSCDGVSYLRDIHYLDRGYEKFHEKYQSLGVDIERIEDVDK